MFSLILIQVLIFNYSKIDNYTETIDQNYYQKISNNNKNYIKNKEN